MNKLDNWYRYRYNT